MQQKWVKVTAIILALLMASAVWALAFTPLYLNKKHAPALRYFTRRRGFFDGKRWSPLCGSYLP